MFLHPRKSQIDVVQSVGRVMRRAEGKKMAPVEGAWLNPETGILVREKVVLAYTYVDPEHFFGSLVKVRGFLHRLGRETGHH